MIEPRAVPFRWAANAGYAALLIVVAILPPSVIASRAAVPDWLAHGAAYGIQSALIFWALHPVMRRRSAVVGAVAGAIGFGTATEALQLLQPERAVELSDVVANAVGAGLVGAALAVVVPNRDREPS